MALESIPVHGGLDIFTITTMRTYWRTFSTLTLTAKLLKNKLKMVDGALKSYKLQNRSNRMKSNGASELNTKNNRIDELWSI